MAHNLHRRRFLQGMSLAGVGYWVAGHNRNVFSDSPNERVNIACIGVGGKGSSDTDQAGNHGNIVALCDIDDMRLNDKAKKFPQAKTYNDYRKLLDEMHAQIDAVVVSTPDHTHAPAAVRAMRLEAIWSWSSDWQSYAVSMASASRHSTAGRRSTAGWK